MSDIFVLVRDQDNVALTSIAGIPFVARLQQNGEILAAETVDLIYADAGFDDLPLGHYVVTLHHERVEPKDVSYEVKIDLSDEVILLTFVYLEPEQILLNVHAAREKRL
ncbi:hypothetical protein [Egbenema bharatensis]|uniref:hypothetical protein n=1 Tax=Egbenema bharatensis TaxID=3463334 RepID=UPI003A836D3A